jgi:hypothetical protein
MQPMYYIGLDVHNKNRRATAPIWLRSMTWKDGKAMPIAPR